MGDRQFLMSEVPLYLLALSLSIWAHQFQIREIGEIKKVIYALFIRKCIHFLIIERECKPRLFISPKLTDVCRTVSMPTQE